MLISQKTPSPRLKKKAKKKKLFDKFKKKKVGHEVKKRDKQINNLKQTWAKGVEIKIVDNL